MSALQGAGPIRFWGFSPALDLTEESAAADPTDAPLRVLLAAPGDVRHLLRTLASLAQTQRNGEARPLELTVHEEAPEALARQLLLLSIAFDFELPRRERAELFLEVFANTLLREKAALYVAGRAQALRRLLAQEEGPLAPYVDLSLLKMKERDALEAVFSTWLDGVDFAANAARDERLRQYYKDRYDARKNVLDWDYSMELVPVASIIHKIHFREWRMSGLAFELRDSAYTSPNRTLASMQAGRLHGNSVMKRGFWGDIANSPYSAFGVETDEPRLLKKSSDQHTKTACDVAYYNLIQWLTLIETGKRFELKEADVADFEYGSSIAGNAGWAKGALLKGVAEDDAETDEPALVDVEEEAAAARQAQQEQQAQQAQAKQAQAQRAKAAWSKLPKFRLRLLGGSWAEVRRKQVHKGHYDSLVVASHCAHVLADPSLNSLLASHARVLVESAKFLCETRKANRQEFGKRICQLAAIRGWSAAAGDAQDGNALAHLRFAYEAASAVALAEEARRALGAGAAAAADEEEEGAAAKLLQLQMADPEERCGAAGAAGSAAAGDAAAGDAAAGDAAAGDAEEAAAAGSAAAAEAAVLGAAAPTAPKAKAAEPALKDHKDLGRVCAITGLPAKYRDPVSGLPYANLDAFRELRKLHPDPRQPPPAEADKGAAEGAAAEGGEQTPEELVAPPQRPIVVSTGGVTRRINKVA